MQRSQTLKLLSPGDRVWVRIPQVGYVGVGEVIEGMQAIKDMELSTDAGPRPALTVLAQAEHFAALADDPERAEYAVRVRWLHTVDVHHAFNELGLFGNQNTVCQPRAAKWRHTVERLKSVFQWRD